MAHDILTTIMAERRDAVSAARSVVPVEALKEQASARKHRSLTARISANAGTSVIAEMKKASPSAGLIRENYEPAGLAAEYAAAGAVGISVLTEPKHFMGGERDLRAARAAVDLPILRKDFICDPYQIWESAAWGADAILLIAAALDAAEMDVLYSEAVDAGLEILAETHTLQELKRVVGLDGAMIGVNSRNLKTLGTDLEIARGMAGFIPPGRLSIAESGIKCRKDVEMLESLGYNAFLVGESLLRNGDPGVKLRELISVIPDGR